MTDARRIFVILDPTTMNQPSLVMGETIAEDFLSSGATDVVLHIYACIAEDTVRRPPDMDEQTARAEEQSRIENWVDRLAERGRSLGLTVVTEVEIHPNWREAIAMAVARQPCVLAIKNMTEQSRLTRWVRETSDWRLLRDTACPLLLVKSYARRHIKNVLVAVKHKPDAEIYEAANDRLLDTGRAMAENVGAELHVLTAYQGDDYPDRQKLADRCGLPRNRVRAAMGSPETVIADVARELPADLVVIARVGKPGSGEKLGHTAQKVIDGLYCNILVLPMTPE
jgi:nucleotide-binding universal stress UspA family protein